MADDLDSFFGTVKKPYKVDAWEIGRVPLSRRLLDKELGRALVLFKNANSDSLFKHAAKCVTYIWAIDEVGDIHISVEELAEMPDGTEITGYPRRRDFPRHPSEEKKLGHPSLVNGNGARIAGELFLDERSGRLFWFVNVNSGRYCRYDPPNATKVANVLSRFIELVEDGLQLDDIGAE